MNARFALRHARRELRGGLRGFAVLILCLALGVAAIAAVGTLRRAIGAGLQAQGAVMLGGDAQMTFSYRAADADERAFMSGAASAVSEIYDFRSMAVVGEGEAADRALTQVKAVDDAYPLTGEMLLRPPGPLAAALSVAEGLPGAVMDPVLADRLRLSPGDSFRLGLTRFRLAALIEREPDGAAAGFTLGPRTIVRTEALAQSGLLSAGSLFETRYRLRLPPGTRLDRLGAEAEDRFRDKGMQWRDRLNGTPGIARFVERMGAFLVLVGLAALAVGGVGIAAAVGSYLRRRTETIAILKAVGATGGTITLAFVLVVAAVVAVGIAIGLLLGGGLPILLAPWIAAQLPFPLAMAPSPAALAEATFYGAATAALFALWPLARVREVRAAALFRDIGAGRRHWPGRGAMLLLAGLSALIVGGAAVLSGLPRLAVTTLAGIAAALVVLALAGLALRRLARGAARRSRGRPALRAALASVAAPNGEASSVVLALGLGLAVLAAVGQVESNLRAAIAEDLPDAAPSFFFVDIQPDQIEGFAQRVTGDPEVSRMDTAPMLRGVITRINDRPAAEVAGDHWVLRGDRGVTYSEAPPVNSRVIAGRWWPAGYAGPPEVSFAAEEAEEMGLRLGDTVTVNVLGRDIKATITSFREVDFSNAGMGFVMVMDPAALKGAPHTSIATVYAAADAEAVLLRDLATAYPNITAIRVRDVVARVAEALGAIAAATAAAASVTLATGLAVLVGAAAAGQGARVYEAALMKTLGATRARILAGQALRAAIMGLTAGIVAVGAGAVAGWAIMTFVMDAGFDFEPVSAIAIVAGGAALNLAAGMVFMLRALAVRPAAVLRARD